MVVQVEADGRVRDCQPVVTSGRPKFDAMVCKLAKAVHYRPAVDVDGKPISSSEIVPFSYEVGAPVTIFVNQ
jgi:outer membrane biosynthesis protein TonB